MATPLLYWRTLRHLRWSQILGRIRFRYHRPALPQTPTPAVRGARVFATEPAVRHATMTGPSAFRFLNQDGRCDTPDAWNDARRGRLWLYNLHYFEDLTARDAAARSEWHRALIVRWIAENPPARGCGWEPYPTSLRIGAWIRWLSAGNAPPAGMNDSLALQARWLRRRIEHHLLGNHLLANARALVLAGMHFVGGEADEWRRTGLALLEQELDRQVLADGGHAERSPMYHSLVLEDLLDLINAAESVTGTVPAPTVEAWRDRGARMLGWLASLTHPDGRIALLNDAAFGVAADPAELHAYGARLGISASGNSRADGSGYVRAERGPAVLIADVAPVGPDEQPGHAHADTLTFELSLFGERVVVDTGTSTYADGPRRAFERSTAAHNTVTIDGRDSSEVWHVFRVGARARLVYADVWSDAAAVHISGAHDGYARLPGRPLHTRSWQLSADSLEIRDHVQDAAGRAFARVLLHPAIRIEGENALRLPNGRRCCWSTEGMSVSVLPAFWHPEFGTGHHTHCLHCVFERDEATLALRWGVA